MVEKINGRPTLLINPRLKDKPSSGDVMTVRQRGRYARCKFCLLSFREIARRRVVPALDALKHGFSNLLPVFTGQGQSGANCLCRVVSRDLSLSVSPYWSTLLCLCAVHTICAARISFFTLVISCNLCLSQGLFFHPVADSTPDSIIPLQAAVQGRKFSDPGGFEDEPGKLSLLDRVQEVGHHRRRGYGGRDICAHCRV